MANDQRIIALANGEALMKECDYPNCCTQMIPDEPRGNAEWAVARLRSNFDITLRHANTFKTDLEAERAAHQETERKFAWCRQEIARLWRETGHDQGCNHVQTVVSSVIAQVREAIEARNALRVAHEATKRQLVEAQALLGECEGVYRDAIEALSEYQRTSRLCAERSEIEPLVGRLIRLAAGCRLALSGKTPMMDTALRGKAEAESLRLESLELERKAEQRATEAEARAEQERLTRIGLQEMVDRAEGRATVLEQSTLKRASEISVLHTALAEAEAARDTAHATNADLAIMVADAQAHIETLREALRYACDAIRSGLHPIMPGPTLEAVLRNADKALAITKEKP